jgi:hypothetical protein
MLRKLLASRKATISIEYALIGVIVIVTVLVSFESYGTVLQLNMQRTACHIAGGTWHEPTGPCS